MKIKRRTFCRLFVIVLAWASLGRAYSQTTYQVAEVAPGVIRITTGQIDRFTPYHFYTGKPQLQRLGNLSPARLPFDVNNIRITVADRGVVVEIPLTEDEHLYGFGLQIGSFDQRGLKKKPIISAIPLNDLGYTHAPLPYYLSTKGYGVLVNTARYPTFYCGNLARKVDKAESAEQPKSGAAATSTSELYKDRGTYSKYVTVDVPGAKGIDLFLFAGPGMKEAVQRYNLFSGGGAMPALWGLGVKYRVKADFTQEQVLKMAKYFREKHIPCDVIGLEPKWQTASYSCSYVWNNDYFPSPEKLIDSLQKVHFHLNLWEHAFVAQKSPLFDTLKKRSGDYLVWNGLVPDFADAETRHIFGSYHEKNFIEKGVSGFKLDECDNSDISRGNVNWSFPEISRFPSGIEGDQMHQMYGILYLKSLYDIYKARNQRVFFDVRASNAFASSFPASLYSDTYDHDEYVRMIPNAGFSGLLWSPEVRESHSVTELMRRSQTAVLSAQTLYNSWYLKNPPWLQYERDLNNKDQFLNNSENNERQIRKLLNFRMSLIPYLYSAFARYHRDGIPPFRALVMDYPLDSKVYDISNEYLIGDALLAAPLTGDSLQRKVYLPQGNWYNFNDNKKYQGGREYMVSVGLDELPVFVKEGAILPLAAPVEFVASHTKFDIECRVYGNMTAKAELFEDDGITYNFEDGVYNIWSIGWSNGKSSVKKTGNFKNSRYKILRWTFIK